MSTQPAILVVDDEEVVCKSCDRILSDEGFRVETSTDVLRGLQMAEGNDYAGILLDIRMEKMDGLEFLKRLRGKKPDVPVIIITGYPSPQTRKVSMRWGASDYIPKPFTPEEVSESVKRVAQWAAPVNETSPADVMEKTVAQKAPAEALRPAPWRFESGHPHFLDETWVRRCEDGQACLGAFLPRLHDKHIDKVVLPRPGDVVHQGLPLGALLMDGREWWSIPSPLSGTVTEVHQAVARSPEVLWEDPFDSGWIVRVRPGRLDDEMAILKTRRVVLVGRDRERAREVRTRLGGLGCDVHIHDTHIEASDLKDPCVVWVDASSCGEDGVRMVERLKESLPNQRVVVGGDRDSRWEASYRALGVFFYLLEPAETTEIADLLFDAFRSRIPPVEPEPDTEILPQFLRRIRLTNRRQRRVSLVADDRLLSRSLGLGQRLVAKILERHCPLENTLTARPTELDEAEILREALSCDALLVLRAGGTGRVPGSVTIEPPTEGSPTGTTRLTVHTEADPGLPLAFDARTTEALADHVVEMLM